ncbi:MAG: IclR family transcriptional regulator [Ilumatobacteraceae bacterium]
MDERGDRSPSGLDILHAVAEHDPTDGPLTSARLAASVGRDRGLVARVVDDLCDLGLVERSQADRSLRLSWGLYAAAAQVVDRRLVTHGQPILSRLARDCGETAYLVVRRAAQSLTVAEAMPASSVRAMSWLGRSQPVARGDAGPVLLMDLDPTELRQLLGSGPLPPTTGSRAPATVEELEHEITRVRATGVCVLVEHTEAGVASVGAPVRDFRGRLAGAVVVVGPSARVDAASGALAEAVRGATRELGLALGNGSSGGR